MAWGGSKIDWTQEAQTREKFSFLLMMLFSAYPFVTLLWDPTMKNTAETKKEITLMQSQVTTLEKILEATAAQPTPGPSPTVEAAPQGVSKDDVRFARYQHGELPSREQVMKEVVQAYTAPTALQGLELMAFSFLEPKEESSYQTVPFDVEVRGAFMATLGYLQRIESAPLLVVLDQAVVESPLDNRSQLKTKLRGILYVVKSAAALGAAPVAGATPTPTASGGHP